MRCRCRCCGCCCSRTNTFATLLGPPAIRQSVCLARTHALASGHATLMLYINPLSFVVVRNAHVGYAQSEQEEEAAWPGDHLTEKERERHRLRERERAAVLRERESKCERVRESQSAEQTQVSYTGSEKLSPRSSSNNCDLQIYCEFILIVIFVISQRN